MSSRSAGDGNDPGSESALGVRRRRTVEVAQRGRDPARGEVRAALLGLGQGAERGVHDASLAESIVRQEREIKDAAFLTLDEVAERASEITVHRVAAALANVDGGTSSYTEGGLSSTS